MYSQTRKYFRFRYRFIFVAFLLISPTASSAPKQHSASLFQGLAECAEIVSALIKDPRWLLKNPDKATIGQKCIQSAKQILEMMKHANAPIVGTELVVVSGYLLYESYKLYERAKGLEQNHDKWRWKWREVEAEFAAIKDYVNKDVKPHWRNGNTAKMVKNLDTLIEKLMDFVDRLDELADRIHQDIKQGSDGKTLLFGYGVAGGVVCVCSMFTGQPLVFTPTCIGGVLTICYSYLSYVSLQETLEKSKVLNKDIMKKKVEITETRVTLEVVKMRADIDM